MDVVFIYQMMVKLNYVPSTGKKKADFIKQFGKREYNRLLKKSPEMIRYKYWQPYFGSFRSLKSHFEKNNESITLVDTL